MVVGGEGGGELTVVVDIVWVSYSVERDRERGSLSSTSLRSRNQWRKRERDTFF